MDEDSESHNHRTGHSGQIQIQIQRRNDEGCTLMTTPPRYTPDTWRIKDHAQPSRTKQHYNTSYHQYSWHQRQSLQENSIPMAYELLLLVAMWWQVSGLALSGKDTVC
jgi:hypothetical protein